MSRARRLRSVHPATTLAVGGLVGLCLVGLLVGVTGPVASATGPGPSTLTVHDQSPVVARAGTSGFLGSAVRTPAATTVTTNGTGNTSAANGSPSRGEPVTVTGLVVNLGRGGQSLRHGLVASTSLNGSKLPPRAFVVDVGNGTVLALAESVPATGVGSVSGRVLRAGGGGRPLVIVARTWTIDGGPPASVDLESLRTDSGVSPHRLVSVTASYRQAGLATLSGETSSTLTRGQLGGDQPDHRLLEHPGLEARWLVHEASFQAVERRVGEDIQGGERTYAFRPRFWVDARATVTGVVVGPGFALSRSSDGGLVVTNVTVAATETDLHTLRTDAASLAGEVVRLRANYTGRRLSAARVLADERCDGIATYSNVTDRCTPLRADVAVHGGVLYGGAPTSWADVVPVAGLSTRTQSSVAVPRRGTYAVTGRVVSADAVDTRLPADHALLVYDLERVGNATAGDVATREAVRWGRAVADALRWQLTASPAQVRAFYDAASSGEEARALTLVESSVADRTVDAGAPVSLTLVLHNADTQSRETPLVVRVGDTVLDRSTVRVPPGRERSVTLEFAVFRPGNHTLVVNNWSVGTLAVTGSPSVTGEPPDRTGLLGSVGALVPGGAPALVAIAVLAVAGAASVARRG
ncbi:MAG: hypothetical protein ABEJ42_02890 [Halobacteriaceae archaeon]